MDSSKKLKVLIVAEAANPEWTSVPLIGWSFSHSLAQLVDAHLVTQIRNAEAISRFGYVEGRDFTAIDTEKLASPINKLATVLRGGKSAGWTIQTAFQSLIYPYFEYKCWKKFKKQLIAGDFDVVHRITPVSPTAPSYLAKKLRKINVPFVVGPINGGVPWPEEFIGLRKQEKDGLSKLRDIFKLLPGYKSLRKNATTILAGSKATQGQLPEYAYKKSIYLPENGIDMTRFSIEPQREYQLPLKAIFIGRLVPYKGVTMAIEAMAPFLKKGLVHYDIIGDGPEKGAIESLISELELQDFVTLHGFVDHAQLQTKLVDAHILVFPSVREFGGGVVLEAMTMGIVPLIVDYAGPSELVDEQVGYKIPIGNRQEVVEQLTNTLETILAEPEALKEKSIAARTRIKNYYTWERKSEQMLEVYSWVLGRRDKPQFFPVVSS